MRRRVDEFDDFLPVERVHDREEAVPGPRRDVRARRELRRATTPRLEPAADHPSRAPHPWQTGAGRAPRLRRPGVLAEGGSCAATVRAAEDRAGLSHGAVRHHFGGRRPFLVALVDHAAAVESEALTRSDPADGVRHWIGARRDVALARFKLGLLAGAILKSATRTLQHGRASSSTPAVTRSAGALSCRSTGSSSTLSCAGTSVRGSARGAGRPRARRDGVTCRWRKGGTTRSHEHRAVLPRGKSGELRRRCVGPGTQPSRRVSAWSAARVAPR